MISWPTIVHLLGYFVLGVTVFLTVPLGLALWEGDGGTWPLLVALLSGLAAGGAGGFAFRPKPHEINRREGILFVVLAWVVLVTLGALPYFFSPHFPGFTDAFFESISGFTTTGATILLDIEGLPRSLLLWRALTHWFGGMGIILLGIAILPLLGTGGMELYRAEFSGAHSEKLKPRIAETALALWKIYVAFTLAEYVALRWAGMTSFDAVCHSFATMATGGFSTKAASIESFQSPAIEYVIIIFMILAGINFTQHYRLFVERNARSFLRDPEIRYYALGIVLAVVAISISLMSYSATSISESFRQSLFQVVSIITTTGFSSVDFELWPAFGTFVLLVLMFIGGCTGSTAGGMKTARIVMLLNVVGREFKRMVERRGVFAVRFGGRAVSEGTVASVLNLVYLAFIINFIACLTLTAAGLDLMTAFSAVVASMFNIGPGLGSVGPAENYAHLPGLVKWVLSFCMLAGRLEFYTVLVIFTPMFWRK
ncbi:MAG TPA: potassium transporter TrkG [Acidobacteriota bacterium]|nr:potassium transporter TrkG [Acidobacteriota bacterium]